METTQYKYRKTSGFIAIAFMIIFAAAAVGCGLYLAAAWSARELNSAILASTFLVVCVVISGVMVRFILRIGDTYTVNDEGIRWSRSKGIETLRWAQIGRLRVAYPAYGFSLYDLQDNRRITVHNDLKGYREFLERLLERVPAKAVAPSSKQEYISSLWMFGFVVIVCLSIAYQFFYEHSDVAISEYILAASVLVGAVVTFQKVIVTGDTVTIYSVEGVRRIPKAAITSLSVAWSPGQIAAINGMTGISIKWGDGNKSFINLAVADLARLYVQLRQGTV